MSGSGYTYPHPRPAVTVDAVVFRLRGAALQVLLIRRGQEPFVGRWALPGGFVAMDETLEESVLRELEEETGLRARLWGQVGAFGDPGRDPRGRTVSVAFLLIVGPDQDGAVRGADDAAEAAWHPVDRLPELAFDHGKILEAGLRRLRADLWRTPVGFWFLPPRFTLITLRQVHERVLGAALDAADFRRRAMAWGVLEECPEDQPRAVRQPEKSYRLRFREEDGGLGREFPSDVSPPTRKT